MNPWLPDSQCTAPCSLIAHAPPRVCTLLPRGRTAAARVKVGVSELRELACGPAGGDGLVRARGCAGGNRVATCRATVGSDTTADAVRCGEENPSEIGRAVDAVVTLDQRITEEVVPGGVVGTGRGRVHLAGRYEHHGHNTSQKRER